MLPSSYKAGGKLWVAISIFYNTGDSSEMLFSEMHMGWPHCAFQRVSAAKAWVSASFTNLFAKHQEDPMSLSQV